VPERVAADVCLQCGETRGAVAAEELICGIMSGYEQPELEYEFARHHWRDWSNAELRAFGIPEDRFDRYRRLDWQSFRWVLPGIRCELEGHTEPSDFAPGCCGRCLAPLAPR